MVQPGSISGPEVRTDEPEPVSLLLTLLLPDLPQGQGLEVLEWDGVLGHGNFVRRTSWHYRKNLLSTEHDMNSLFSYKSDPEYTQLPLILCLRETGI